MAEDIRQESAKAQSEISAVAELALYEHQDVCEYAKFTPPLDLCCSDAVLAAVRPVLLAEGYAKGLEDAEAAVRKNAQEHITWCRDHAQDKLDNVRIASNTELADIAIAAIRSLAPATQPETT